MGEQTNMERIDEEIGRFVREQLERAGPVTGWVLCVSTMRYSDNGDGDPLYAWDYSCGPQTDLIRAFGLVHTVKVDIEQMIWNAAREIREGD